MNKNKFFLGFLLGAAAAGTATAVLYKNKGKIRAKLLRMRMRAEIEQRAAELKEFTKGMYEDIVEETIEKYRSTRAFSRADLELLKSELKRNWKEVKRSIENAVREEKDDLKGMQEEDDED